ncbi:MAG: nucleotidyl transferase AbiEii/AbiGii toxin family protein [Thaumarchaeota archaeon]|nr:nucleotidyl transferase AbiEii/AbiGii toxin family protein [Nitrososphaerota archaeon]MCL5318422.1 nucleotidyl transferase AbiEii/AbiGii toxin family protein [Nitrososphaerota archaeon]
MDKDELRRLAKQTGFDLAALEKDYALTWLLGGIYSKESGLRDLLVFKGGTAIRKVYFPEWRLSEDLDFTVVQKIGPGMMKQEFERVFQLLKASGITYLFSSFNHRGFAVFAEVKFLGPLGFRNRITLDISLKEKMIEQPARIAVKPEYRDIPEFGIQVYSMNEILVEKIRSIFQGGKARDYYDVWRLLQEDKFDAGRIKALLIKKCEITGVEFRPESIFDETRLSEARKFWVIGLERLTKNLPDFEMVISELKDRLSFLK